jgi:hypothetical protein
MKDALSESGVQRDRINALLGWKEHGVSGIYGAGLGANTLAEEISKVAYEGLNLEHLRPGPINDWPKSEILTSRKQFDEDAAN